MKNILIAAILMLSTVAFAKDKKVYEYQTGTVTAVRTPTGRWIDNTYCHESGYTWTCSGDWTEETNLTYALTAADGTVYHLEYAGVLDRHDPLRFNRGVNEIKFRLGTIGTFQYGPPQCRHANNPCVFVPKEDGKEAIYSPARDKIAW